MANAKRAVLVTDPVPREPQTKAVRRSEHAVLVTDPVPDNNSAEPTDRQLRALRTIDVRERGGDAWLDKEAAEECCDHGWAIGTDTGYQVTDAGRRLIT